MSRGLGDVYKRQDGAAGTEDADAGGKTNVAENGQVIGTLPVF